MQWDVRVQLSGGNLIVTIPKVIAEDMQIEKFTDMKVTYDEATKEVKYTKKKVG